MSIEFNNINSQRPDTNRNQASKETEAARKNDAPSDKASTETKGASPDSVSLSQKAQSLARIEAELKSLPEVDQARVDEIKARIEDGSYQVDLEKLAQKMLDLES